MAIYLEASPDSRTPLHQEVAAIVAGTNQINAFGTAVSDWLSTQWEALGLPDHLRDQPPILASVSVSAPRQHEDNTQAAIVVPELDGNSAWLVEPGTQARQFSIDPDTNTWYWPTIDDRFLPIAMHLPTDYTPAWKGGNEAGGSRT